MSHILLVQENADLRVQLATAKDAADSWMRTTIAIEEHYKAQLASAQAENARLRKALEFASNYGVHATIPYTEPPTCFERCVVCTVNRTLDTTPPHAPAEQPEPDRTDAELLEKAATAALLILRKFPWIAEHPDGLKVGAEIKQTIRAAMHGGHNA